MKRSRQIALVTMGLTTLALSACEEPQTPASVFRTVDECTKSGEFSTKICNRARAYAIAEHDVAAPYYQTREECEEKSGGKSCEELSTGRNSQVYRPSIVAFMFSSSGKVHPQPLYRAPGKSGHFVTTDNSKVGGKVGSVLISKSAARKPVAKTITASRGGFGSNGKAKGSSGHS